MQLLKIPHKSFLSKRKDLLLRSLSNVDRNKLLSIKQVKLDIVPEAKNMAQMGLTAGSGGNISVRNGNEIYITTAGSRFAFLKEKDICVVDMNGKLLNCSPGKKPSSELPLHLEVYKNREDVNSVIHCHPVYASTYAVAGKPPLKSILPHTTKHFHDIKVAEYFDAGSNALAHNTVKTLGKSEAVLMGNHGVLVTGKNLGVASKTVDSLENYCKISYLIENSNFSPKFLSPQQVNYMLGIKPVSRKKVVLDKQMKIFNSQDKNYIPYLPNYGVEKTNLVKKFIADPSSVNIEKLVKSTDSILYKISDNINQVLLKMQHFADSNLEGIAKRKKVKPQKELNLFRQLPGNLLGTINNKKNQIIALVLD